MENGEDYTVYPGGTNVITGSLRGGRGRQKESEKDVMMEAWPQKCYITGYEDRGREPPAKGCKKPLETEKSK